ncbi:SdiA-regulated domain-containing protein [Pseudomonas vanderleydeniana]|uniref:SdiA-regulated domain-containing protein n=1 Tax=Pseudomonas vanderleydeniana TaxID=2745495 RepID=A0A9E6PKR8_9PSED|nr:SdiA-regulated domain-containing protein [Pseudomonas vanderleydeniana]QXI28263.1 SdiA-regulated domain-containing protein [Pseudomonas vanderleydeniana]
MSSQTFSSPSPAGRSRFARRWYYWLLLAIVVIGVGLSMAMHWDDRGLLWLKERFETPAERQQSIWLPGYRAVIDAKPLVGMEKDEASDVSYNPRTRTLFSVMGKNPFLSELTLQGDVLRKIPLVGWNNPEAVTVLEGDKLAIVDERMHILSIVTVDASTRELNIKDFPQYDLGPSKDQNKAFEAVVWDARNQRILLGEERPPALFSLKSDGTRFMGEKQKLASDQLDVRNLSALAIDPRTQHLLVLSAESHLLLELDEKGNQVSFMTLLGGFNGLKHTIPRAEGVTMDEEGTVYVVSEPNLFYVFKRTEQ